MKKYLAIIIALAASLSGTDATFAKIDRSATTTAPVEKNDHDNGKIRGVLENKTPDIASLKDKANKEIDRRLAALDNQLGRIGQMARLTDAQKNLLRAGSQGVIDSLTSFRAKINADTDILALKADIQSIAKSERVYLLVIPQIAILSASERVNSAASMLSGIQAKLANRVASAPDDSDMTAANSALADMKTRLAAAQTAAQNAAAAVGNLKPDNGVKTTLAANNAALKNGREQIIAAQKGLRAAQKDAQSILLALKAALKSQPKTENTGNNSNN